MSRISRRWAAEALGMDYKLIARSFKKVTGMTPGEYSNDLEKNASI